MGSDLSIRVATRNHIRPLQWDGCFFYCKNIRIGGIVTC